MRNIRTFKQLLFRIFVRPFFPLGQWVVLQLNLYQPPQLEGRHHDRQPHLLGHLKQHVTIGEAKRHLHSQGFFMNRIAYPDPGQMLSMRRLDEALPDRHYHLRIFEDGEVRGHYEYTPEDRPSAHLHAELFEKREEKFAPWLDAIVI